MPTFVHFKASRKKHWQTPGRQVQQWGNSDTLRLSLHLQNFGLWAWTFLQGYLQFRGHLPIIQWFEIWKCFISIRIYFISYNYILIVHIDIYLYVHVYIDWRQAANQGSSHTYFDFLNWPARFTLVDFACHGCAYHDECLFTSIVGTCSGIASPLDLYWEADPGVPSFLLEVKEAAFMDTSARWSNWK